MGLDDSIFDFNADDVNEAGSSEARSKQVKGLARGSELRYCRGI
jgi:hypothetical protein